ncbi:helix-turn-helix domain-containing protein [Antarcticirhabdus aurantiaca]|uniref:Uncharacterized protein n=1 Tax=Antarcticirhabdus aurantiaca TaxID=2606717 RepID=A0ACD4NTX7_9HYPH|nr:helix-turn-helix domain-containing protein [Antarcticirhabdus aurantiaca]WAJ30193.1 hypothetical protein OXU80_08295 [Jeongeuplla avenae]
MPHPASQAAGFRGRPEPPARSGRSPDPAARVRCDVAAELAGAFLGVPVEKIRHPRRQRAAICRARHVAMYIANVSFRVSLTAMAAEFGRDRSSCSHAVGRIEDGRDDPALDALLERLDGLTSVLDAALPPLRETSDGEHRR